MVQSKCVGFTFELLNILMVSQIARTIWMPYFGFLKISHNLHDVYFLIGYLSTCEW